MVFHVNRLNCRLFFFQNNNKIRFRMSSAIHNYSIRHFEIICFIFSEKITKLISECCLLQIFLAL